MKSLKCIPAILAILCLMSCNNAEQTAKHTEKEAASETVHASNTETNETKTIAVSFTNVDPKAAGTIHGIIGQYLSVKNALASDNAAEAAAAAGALGDVIKTLDKSLLTADQKTAYDKAEEIIRQQAAQIADTAGDIARQRSSFFPLSEGIYTIATQFGGGRTLYHDHCPMARDNQGALWISEQKDIRNPYFGSGMLTCGTVEEVIQ